jgi:hypothetical protein
MAVGVASANSILLVTFAREQQLKGRSAFRAALDAGRTRIRPVLMTAAAMVVGMIPMAIGGAGEEQNAALARAACPLPAHRKTAKGAQAAPPLGWPRVRSLRVLSARRAPIIRQTFDDAHHAG